MTHVPRQARAARTRQPAAGRTQVDRRAQAAAHHRAGLVVDLGLRRLQSGLSPIRPSSRWGSKRRCPASTSTSSTAASAARTSRRWRRACRPRCKPEPGILVVWQIGTNAAIRPMPLDKFARCLRNGLTLGKSLGADFVLMNLQYVPAVVAAARQGGLRARHGRRRQGVRRRPVPPLRHHARLVQGRHALRAVRHLDGLHLNDFGQKCIGKLLSKAIIERSIPKQLTGASPALSATLHEASFRRPVDLSRERRHLRSRAVRAEDPVSQARRTRPARSPASSPASRRKTCRTARAGRSRTSTSRPTTAPISTRPIISIRR